MTLSAAENVAAMTLGDWLARFETAATPAEAQQMALSLGGILGQRDPDIDPVAAAAFLRGLNGPGEHVGALGPHAGRPITDFIFVDAPSRRFIDAPHEALTARGRASSSLARYLGGTIWNHFAHGGRTDPAYARSEEVTQQALARYSFETLPAQADPTERRHAFQIEHARRLNWAAAHVSGSLSFVPDKVRGRYEKIASEVRDENKKARVLLDLMDQHWNEHAHLAAHERNIKVAPTLAQVRKAIEGYRHRIVTLDREWQKLFFQGVLETARARPTPPSHGDEARFQKALAAFENASKDHLAYWQRLIDGEPKTSEARRKNWEEKAYRALMHGPDSLLAVTQSLLERTGHPQAAELKAPLTFYWKSQAYRIAPGPSPLVSAERFVERTADHMGIINDAYEGRVPLAALDQAAALSWAIPMVADFYSQFRLAAPAGAPLFTHHVPPELAMIRGALAVYGDHTQQQHRVVSNQNHGDPIDYPALFMFRYLLGLEPPATVAEEAFAHVPGMNKVIRMTAGGFLARGDDEKARKKREALYRALAEKIADGRDAALFGTGTRALGEALASRYSDLDRAGALHNPGEFEMPGAMRGMEILLAMKNQADIRVIATNLHRGGVGEPSIPRSLSGFLGANATAFSFPSPAPEAGFAAYAGEIRHADLITPADVPEATIQRVNDLNTAIEWFMMVRAGYAMDAGPNIQ